jgi:hypothetical protein
MSKRPDEVLKVFNRTWLIPFGTPRNVLSDNGGEFVRELSDLVESLGATVLRTARVTPRPRTEPPNGEKQPGRLTHVPTRTSTAYVSQRKTRQSACAQRSTGRSIRKLTNPATHRRGGYLAEVCDYSTARWLHMASWPRRPGWVKTRISPAVLVCWPPLAVALHHYVILEVCPKPSRHEDVVKPRYQPNGLTTLLTRSSTGVVRPRTRQNGCTDGLALA